MKVRWIVILVCAGAIVASVLGEDEAARIAAETRGGPLSRECGL